jgi:hypothetical protein
MEEILVGQTFSNLRRVVFLLYDERAHSSRNARTKIMERMKLLAGRGSLTFATYDADDTL